MPSLVTIAREYRARRQRQRTDLAIRKVVKPYVPHPLSPKQRAFLSLTAGEALYGGAAGGGKSDALIADALQFIDRPSYAALLMRRRDVDLTRQNAILDRATRWFEGTPARWDDDLYGFRFPSGATLSFGHLTRLADREKWKGPEFQYIGIDELTDWSESDYRFMFSRLRSLVGGVPTRMRATTNPGGEGHDWVFERFVRWARQVDTGLEYDTWRKGAREGSPYFESPPSDDVKALARELNVRAQPAVFVPAFATDNPGLNVAEYRMNLAMLDPVERAWYDEGDWTAVPSGRYFHREWFNNRIDVEPPGVFWIRYWDLAGTEPKSDAQKKEAEKAGPAWTAGIKIGVRLLKDGSHQVVIGDVRRDRLEPPDVEEFLKATAELDKKRVQIVIEQEPGSSGKAVIISYQRRVLFGWTVHGDKVTGPKESFWSTFAAFAKAGGVVLVRGEWNEPFIKELISLPTGKKDQADAASRGYAWLIGDEGKRLYRMAGLANLS